MREIDTAIVPTKLLSIYVTFSYLFLQRRKECEPLAREELFREVQQNCQRLPQDGETEPEDDVSKPSVLTINPREKNQRYLRGIKNNKEDPRRRKNADLGHHANERPEPDFVDRDGNQQLVKRGRDQENNQLSLPRIRPRYLVDDGQVYVPSNGRRLLKRVERRCSGKPSGALADSMSANLRAKKT